MASERAGQAGVSRHLDAGAACAAPGRRRSLLPAMPRSPRHNVPPLLRVPGPAHGEGHASLTGGTQGGTFSRAAVQGTVCTTHFPFPGHDSANRCARTTWPSFVAQPTLRRAPRWGTFSPTALLRAAARCDELAGLWWRSTCGAISRRQPMGRCRATCSRANLRAMARTMRRRWQGNSRWTRSRCISTAKVPSPQLTDLTCEGCQGRHTSVRMFGAGFWLPMTRSGQPRSRGTPQCTTWRPGVLPTCSKGETTLPTCSPRKCADAHKPPFRIAKTVVACASLAMQAARWAAEAHVLLRLRGWDDTKAAAPRTRTRPARARLKRKFKAEAAAPASGKACDWLATHTSPRQSRKTVLSTLVLSEGTACFWGTSSTRGAGLWTTTSSSAPNVGPCSGNVPTRCAEAADSTQVGALHNFANSGPACVPTKAIQAGHWSMYADPPWRRRTRWWRSWNLARQAWDAQSWGRQPPRNHVLPHRQQSCCTGDETQGQPRPRTRICGTGRTIASTTWRRLGSTRSWWTSSPSRLGAPIELGGDAATAL